MKNKPLSFVAIPLILSVCCAGLHESPCRGADEPAKKLLENGGLEDKLDPVTALPAGWTVTQKPENGYKVEVVDGGRTGKKCLRISGEGESVRIRLKHLPMSPEKRSVVSGWLKCTGGTGTLSLMHRYVDANDKGLNSTTIGAIGAGMTNWTQTAMIEHPEYTRPGANAEFIINCYGKIDALVDDLEVFTLGVTPDDLTWAAGDFESHYNGALPPVNKVTASPDGTVETSLSDKNPANGRYCLRMKAVADWATTTLWPINYDAGKVYTLTGKVRVNKGRASLRIDFYKDGNRTDLLGSKTIDATESKDWQSMKVDTTDNTFPAATHITATAICHGDAEAFFDQMVLLAK